MDAHECMCMSAHTNKHKTYLKNKKKTTRSLIAFTHLQQRKRGGVHTRKEQGALYNLILTSHSRHTPVQTTTPHPFPFNLNLQLCNKAWDQVYQNTSLHHDLHEKLHELLKKTARNKIFLPSKWDVRQAATETAQHPAHG